MRSHYAVGVCESWNLKFNEGKTQVIYFCGVPGDELQLNERDINFQCSTQIKKCEMNVPFHISLFLSHLPF
jgi:hypothetical protein